VIAESFMEMQNFSQSELLIEVKQTFNCNECGMMEGINKCCLCHSRRVSERASGWLGNRTNKANRFNDENETSELSKPSITFEMRIMSSRHFSFLIETANIFICFVFAAQGKLDKHDMWKLLRHFTHTQLLFGEFTTGFRLLQSSNCLSEYIKLHSTVNVIINLTSATVST